jgi:hypothetical protein
MKLAQDISGLNLTVDQYSLAERLALEACAAGVKLSVRTLVDVWRREPSLVAFADALGEGAIPGGLQP